MCDIEAIMQLFPAKLDYVKLTVDDEYDYRSLHSSKIISVSLSKRSKSVQEFSNSGITKEAPAKDILDVYPVNSENPVRIDFFGDTVERIREVRIFCQKARKRKYKLYLRKPRPP